MPKKFSIVRYIQKMGKNLPRMVEDIPRMVEDIPRSVIDESAAMIGALVVRRERAAVDVPANVEAQPTVTVADLLLAYLNELGIEYMFGVPGGAISPLYDALARSERNGGLRHVLARHEAGAAYMADGYTRECRKLGVCCTTSGPGATNLITAAACAYDNNIPMLVITGQPALPAFGKGPVQESSDTGVNTIGMLNFVTRFNTLISHPNQLEAKLVSALKRAFRAPRGPVHLSIPVDILRSPSPVTKPSFDVLALLAPSSMADHDGIELLRQMLKDANKVVLLVGGWCGEAIGAILQFAALTGASIVTTPDGKGLVSPYHPLFRGVFGFGGHATAEAVLRDPEVDLILAVGAGMGELNSGGWSESLLNERLVHIDENEDNFARTPMACFHVSGRILAIFSRLVELLNEESKSDNAEYERQRASREANNINWNPHAMLDEPDKFDSDATPIKPQRLMRDLARMFPPTTRFLADTGNSLLWAVHYLHPTIDRRIGERRMGGGGRKPSMGRRGTDSGWLRVTMDFAAMGWAIGAAVGTAIANPHAPVVCITGDGSMLMNGQELSAAVAERLSIVFVVLNDQALGMVKHGQRLAKAEQIGVFMPPTDFAAMARAMGATAYNIRSPEELLALDVNAMCGRKGPTLLDVAIDPDEVPPMKVRVQVLAESK